MDELLLRQSNVLFEPIREIAVPICRAHGLSPAHIQFLRKTNGLSAWRGALHIFGVGAELDPTHDLVRWNGTGGWRSNFGEIAGQSVAFAETCFGDQFILRDGGICKFLAETGHLEFVANSFDGWVSAVTSEPDRWIEFDIASAWARNAGISEIPIGKHIFPQVPFSLGGSIEGASDACTIDALEDMRFKGQLATQLSRVAPGEKVSLQTINFPVH